MTLIDTAVMRAFTAFQTERNEALALFRAAWEVAGASFYRREMVLNWDCWRQLDGDIVTLGDAVAACNRMLASLEDQYTHLIVPPNFAAQLQMQQLAPPPCTYRIARNGVGYIKINTFAHTETALSLNNAMRQLQACAGLIVDLRGNGGGYLAEAYKAAALFLDAGPLMEMHFTAPDHGEQLMQISLHRTHVSQTTRFAASPLQNEVLWLRFPNLSGGRPIVLLVDEGTASASELFVDIMLDHNRAFVIGSSISAGKGICQNEYPLPLGFKVKVTNGTFVAPQRHWRGDAQRQRHGIIPQLFVPGGPFDFAVDAAIDHIERELRCNVPVNLAVAVAAATMSVLVAQDAA